MRLRAGPPLTLLGPGDASSWDPPCESCGVKPSVPGCDGQCDDCWVEAGLLELLCSPALEDVDA